MPATPEFPITVFFDGACSVCATEIELYKRKDVSGRLNLVDINASGFDPSPYRITISEFMYELHVIDRLGTVYKGVEAFWAIWQAFPASTLYGFMGTAITLPVINQLARLGYKAFARIRKYLPKRKQACESGICRIGRNDD